MKLLKDPFVKEYKASFGSNSICHHTLTECQCIYSNGLPIITHKKARALEDLDRQPYEENTGHVKFLVPYITKEIYYPAPILKNIIYEMLKCNKMKYIVKFHCLLDLNLRVHPPCADYMKLEYRNLFLSPSKENLFDGMSLWNYLLNLFECLINGTSTYGDNEAYDLAFQRFFDFCVHVLQMDYDFSIKKGTKPLIMECVNYNPRRKTRMKDITKYLDMLFNSGYDFSITIVNLALLIDQMRSKD